MKSLNEFLNEGIKEKTKLQEKEAKEAVKSFVVGDSVELKKEYHKHGSIRTGKVVKVYKEDGDLKVVDDKNKNNTVLYPASYFSKK